MTKRLMGINLRRWSKLAVILVITVLSVSACAKNQPPVIQSVTAEKIGNSDNEYEVVCVATDADNDDLVYLWTTNDGVVQGTGNSITWTVPEAAGDYTVTVVAKDAKGGESTGSTSIEVEAKPSELPEQPEPPKLNQPPMIVELTSENTKIRIWTTTKISCIAEDPDGDQLTYIWSTPKGKIVGEGNNVLYIAPGDSGEYTVPITVKVNDGKDGQAVQTIEIEIFCCGSG